MLYHGGENYEGRNLQGNLCCYNDTIHVSKSFVPSSKAQNVDINGQSIDTVIAIKNEQEKIWFFWFIENLDVEEIDKVVINGL